MGKRCTRLIWVHTVVVHTVPMSRCTHSRRGLSWRHTVSLQLNREGASSSSGPSGSSARETLARTLCQFTGGADFTGGAVQGRLVTVLDQAGGEQGHDWLSRGGGGSLEGRNQGRGTCAP